MTRLHELHAKVGQSPWLDNLRRAALVTGELQHMVEALARIRHFFLGQVHQP